MGQRSSVSIGAFASVRVELDNSSYVPGEIVQGVVVVNVMQDTPVKDFEIIFMGDLVSKNFIMPEKITIAKQQVKSMNVAQNKLPPGEVRIPFDIIIPSVCLPTLEIMEDYRKLVINYALQIWARPPGWFQAKQLLCSKAIYVSSAQIKDEESRFVRTFDISTNGLFGFYKITGGFTVEAKGYQSAYEPGGKCILDIQLDNQSTIDVAYSGAKLVQKLVLTSPTFSKSKDRAWKLQPIFRINEMKKEEGGTTSRSFGRSRSVTKASLEFVLPVNTDHQSLSFLKNAVKFEVQHLIQLKFAPASKLSSYVRLDIPVMIVGQRKEEEIPLAIPVEEACIAKS